MKARVLVVAMAVVCALVLSSASGYDLSAPDKSWDEFMNKGAYRIYSRDGRLPDTREVMLVGVLDYPPKAVFDVCTDYRNYKDFMPNVTFSHVIDSQEQDPHKRTVYVFYCFDAPLVSTRYYTIEYQDEMDVTVDGMPGSYKNTWKLVKNGPYHRTPDSPDIKQLLKHTGGVELALNDGYWIFEPLDGGMKTRMEYYLANNPGGSVPRWIANRMQVRSLPEWWEAIQDRLKNPQYVKPR